ncbi:MAG: hypothetical protein KH812_16765, partial [Proteus hauseri]|nr:hypothetical protein [Proteus hauseri]
IQMPPPQVPLPAARPDFVTGFQSLWSPVKKNCIDTAFEQKSVTMVTHMVFTGNAGTEANARHHRRATVL